VDDSFPTEAELNVRLLDWILVKDFLFLLLKKFFYEEACGGGYVVGVEDISSPPPAASLILEGLPLEEANDSKLF